jgi:serine/threonine-protein kinase HipA
VSLERRDLAMECGDLGRFANAKNILSQCRRFLLEEDEAKAIITEMSKQIKSNWYSTVRAHGITEADATKISSAFAYDGFDF